MYVLSAAATTSASKQTLWDVNEITWDECNDCLANGYEDVDGHFVVDKSLKGLAVKAIQEASSE
jgi:hypothetical protein